MDVATFETPKERDTVSDFVGALGGELFFINNETEPYLNTRVMTLKRFGP
jgi:hypothetical protein